VALKIKIALIKQASKKMAGDVLIAGLSFIFSTTVNFIVPLVGRPNGGVLYWGGPL